MLQLITTVQHKSSDGCTGSFAVKDHDVDGGTQGAGNLKEAHQSNKKTESQMNIDSDFYYSITLCNKQHSSLFIVLSLCFVKMPTL